MLIRSTLASLTAILLAAPAFAQTTPPPGPAPTASAPAAAPKPAAAGTAAAPAPARGAGPVAAPKPPPAATTKPGPTPGPGPKPPPPTKKDAPAGGTSASVSVGTQAPPQARAHGPARRRSADPDEIERRVITFTDGPSPRMVSHGSSYVHGPLELEVRFRNPNPLCYAYSTNIGASRIAASDQPVPEHVPGITSLGSFSPSSYADVDAAFAGVNAAHNEIDELLHAARFQASLDDVWAGCDAGGKFAIQRARVEAAAKTIASRLGTGGAWAAVLERAEAAALGAKRLVRGMGTEAGNAAEALKARQGDLAAAEKAGADAEAKADRAGRTRATAAHLEETAREIARAQRKLREAELAVAEQHRAADLARAAEQLGDRVRFAMKTLSTMTADVNRARALLAQSPTAIRRRFGAGETVTVVVERTRLDGGERVAGRSPQLFEVEPFETLRPITLDIGLGPALAIGQNASKYETVWAPRDETDATPAWRVVRTDQGVNLDLMVAVSVYIWKRRYLDDGVFDAWQLLPRPVAGISLDRPFDVFYLGLQIDPIQYLNLMGGVRIGTESQLIGPQPLDRALLDPSGEPQPPVTRDEIQVSGFVGFNVSTNLIYRWIKQGL